MTSKRILLGITGGVAAYKSADLVRRLVKKGHTVEVVMTQSATQFITPMTFQALSGHAVYTDLWDERPEHAMAHIDLSRRADVFLIAPATANTIAKIAHGLCDDLMSTLAAARTCPLIVAPAMNKQMWDNPPNQRNIAQLKADGIRVLGPASGEQACGEVGAGRMLEPEEIVQALDAFFTPKALAGKKILITAGPTQENIDPVRAITNLSSGKMGYALAQACINAGAEVTLISGPTSLNAPTQAKLHHVKSAHEMYQAVLHEIAPVDVFIAVAAVADYGIKNPSEKKLKKDGKPPVIELAENPDILANIAKLPHAPFCVGFAAESHDVLENAKAKRLRKGIPLLIANQVQTAMGSDQNQVTLIDDQGETELPCADKTTVARAIVEAIAQRLPHTH